MFLLDTNAESELHKAGDGKADRRLTDWFSDKDSSTFFISVITLMELEIGVLRGVPEARWRHLKIREPGNRSPVGRERGAGVRVYGTSTRIAFARHSRMLLAGIQRLSGTPRRNQGTGSRTSLRDSRMTCKINATPARSATCPRRPSPLATAFKIVTSYALHSSGRTT